nr:DUF4421 family protein [Myroides oncorhynchi]
MIFLFFFTTNYGQVDSSYVKEHVKPYGAKVYFGKDILALDYDFEESKQKQTFQSNKPTTIGIGFLWGSSSLSFSYGFSFMRDKQRGKTKATDFQYHYYGDKFLIDLYYKRNKGFYRYSDNKKGDIPTINNIYPDFSINMYGLMLQYVSNNTRYSLGAAYDFNRVQIKSAGSLLVGGGVFYTSLHNIPTVSENISDFDKRTYHFGPNIGYGYNWVPYKKTLVAGAFTLGINGAIEENLLTNKTSFIVNPTAIGRFTIGYIGEEWIITGTALTNGLFLNFKENYQTSLLSSNFTFTVIKRFTLKKEIRFLKKGYDWKSSLFGSKTKNVDTQLD